MRTIKELVAGNVIFKSTIWDDVVTAIRNCIDPTEENAYTFNTVDNILAEDFGDYELNPELIDSDDGTTVTYDTYALARRVDTVIGQNKEYWLRFVQSIEAEFNPLWNVDGTEEITHVHAKQKVTDELGKVKLTDKYGTSVTSESLGDVRHKDAKAAVTVTQKDNLDDPGFGNDANKVTTTHGARSEGHNVADSSVGVSSPGKETTRSTGTTVTEHDETTMDSLTYKAKSRDTVAQTGANAGSESVSAYADKYGEYSDTVANGPTKSTTDTNQHTDELTITHRRHDSDTDPEANTYTRQNYDDVHETDAHTNTKTSDAYTDTDTIRKFGNIGVTKTTELLEDNIAFGKKLRLATIIANEISKKLALACIWY